MSPCRCCFIERNADCPWAECAQIAARFQPACSKMTSLDSTSTRMRIEKVVVCDFVIRARVDRLRVDLLSVNALGDRAQSFGTMIDRIHRCDDSEKHLRRADVARGFIAADVLLARLQREAICRMAFGVVRHANESARHVTFVLVACGEICSVRPAESERDSEALRISNRYVSVRIRPAVLAM